MPSLGYYHRADGEIDFGSFNGSDFIPDSRSLNDRRGGTRSVSASTEPSDSYAFNKISGQLANLEPTNGDYTSPEVNISASDLQGSNDTFIDMRDDQQIFNNSVFRAFYDMIVAETDRINELSKQNTEDARRYSEYVYKNQARWYVDGLKKAGINPLMIAHGLSPTSFTSMGSAQVFKPDTPTTEYANTVNTQINALVSLFQHAERLDFDERVAYLQYSLGLKEVEAKRYATNIGALTDIFGSATSALSRILSPFSAIASFL